MFDDELLTWSDVPVIEEWHHMSETVYYSFRGDHKGYWAQANYRNGRYTFVDCNDCKWEIDPTPKTATIVRECVNVLANL